MIKATGVGKWFGSLEVLRGVNLEVEKGEVSVLIGPSGSGKSTLLRCMNGLETFSSGSIRVGERDLPPGRFHRRNEPVLRYVRQRVGMVFQQFNLFPHRSVLGNIIEGPVQVLGMPRDAAIERARQLLDRVGLADKIDAYPKSLSGGQQQRVAIARALAMDPEAILFDEPTSALDPQMTAEVLAVLADLAATGQTMIVVTHAMSFARRAAHRVHVFAAGRIIESGAPAEIFDNPKHPETVRLLHSESALTLPAAESP